MKNLSHCHPVTWSCTLFFLALLIGCARTSTASLDDSAAEETSSPSVPGLIENIESIRVRGIPFLVSGRVAFTAEYVKSRPWAEFTITNLDTLRELSQYLQKLHPSDYSFLNYETYVVVELFGKGGDTAELQFDDFNRVRMNDTMYHSHRSLQRLLRFEDIQTSEPPFMRGE